MDSPASYIPSDAPGEAPRSPPFSDSRRVNDEIWRRMVEVEDTIQGLLDMIHFRRNAIVLDFVYIGAKTGRDRDSAVMIFDRVAFSDRIVRVKD